MMGLWAYSCLAVAALLVGSLLNLIIYRLPIMIQTEWESQCQQVFKLAPIQSQPNINLFTPRSFCPNCKKMIPIWHNIPLLSYMILKGRCNRCKQAIPIRYPLVEASTLLLALYAAWHFGFNSQLLFAFPFICLVITLVVIDIQHQLLPDCLTLGLLWLGLIANTQLLFTPITDAVIGAVAGYLTLWLIIKLYYLVTGKIGMGHGDFKLFAEIGLNKPEFFSALTQMRKQ